jgi:hypothetical protein
VMKRDGMKQNADFVIDVCWTPAITCIIVHVFAANDDAGRAHGG